MKTIDAIRALEALPKSEGWYTLIFDCYASADDFCKACFGTEALIVQMCSLSGQTVLITTAPLKLWWDEAPIFDAVIIDPDGFKLNAHYIYMLEV